MRDGIHGVDVMGAVALPAAGAAAVATATALHAAEGLAPGVSGLARLVESADFISELIVRYGVSVSEYEGLRI